MRVPVNGTLDQLKAWVLSQICQRLTIERSVLSRKGIQLDRLVSSPADVRVESFTELNLDATMPLLGGTKLPPIGRTKLPPIGSPRYGPSLTTENDDTDRPLQE